MSLRKNVMRVSPVGMRTRKLVNGSFSIIRRPSRWRSRSAVNGPLAIGPELARVQAAENLRHALSHSTEGVDRLRGSIER